jgi:hypothetical protein
LAEFKEKFLLYIYIYTYYYNLFGCEARFTRHHSAAKLIWYWGLPYKTCFSYKNRFLVHKLRIRNCTQEFLQFRTVEPPFTYAPLYVFSIYVPSKPLTLDLMETLDLFFRRACYHWNAAYRKMKRIKVVETFSSTNSVLFISCTWFIHRSYRAYKKKSKVSVRSKVRGFYGTFLTNWVRKVGVDCILIHNFVLMATLYLRKFHCR